MTTKGKATFQKRQREMAKKDRQRRKLERREQRKLEKAGARPASYEGGQEGERRVGRLQSHPVNYEA